MLTIETSRSLTSQIVQALAQSPGVSANWLRKEVSRRYKAVTLQALYQALRQLQKKGVVVKAKKQFSLRLPWVMQVLSFSELLTERYLRQSQLEQIFQPGMRSSSWHFTDLRKLDLFWTQYGMALFSETGISEMYFWIPHPWFDLAHQKREREFQAAVLRAGYRLRGVVGGNTFLDRSYAVYQNPKSLQLAFAEEGFPEPRDRYLCLIADYVMTIRLDKHTAQAIDTLYDTVKSAKALNLALVNELFDRKVKASVTLEVNPRKARKLRALFHEFLP